MTKYNQKQTFIPACERYFLESCFQLCGDLYSPKQRKKQAFFSIPGMRGKLLTYKWRLCIDYM